MITQKQRRNETACAQLLGQQQNKPFLRITALNLLLGYPFTLSLITSVNFVG